MSILALLLIINTPFSQTQLHRLYQIENTNKGLSQFFKNLGISFKSDTIYVFIIPPANALRIEGSINIWIDYLRKANVKDIITIIPYSKERAVKKYFKRMNFLSDYNFSVDESFLKFFYFYTPQLQVPFVAKFSINKGELLASRSLMGVTDSAAVFSFIRDFSKPKIKRPKKLKLKKELKGDISQPILKKILKLSDTEDFPLSKTHWIRVSPNNNYLAVVDDLTFTIYIFDLKTGKLENILFPDTAEEKRFIEIPISVYQFLKRYITIASMYCACDFYDDTTLFITATLPKIVMETKDKDTTIEWYNVACIITKHIFNNNLINLNEFASLPESVKGGFSHLMPSFIFEKGLIFCHFRKGWPYGYEVINEKIPSYDNPFSEEFYKKDNFLFVVYNLNGEFLHLLGRLSKKHEKLRLGYITQCGLVRFYNGFYYVCDGYSGEIYCYDGQGNFIDTIKLIKEPTPKLPRIDKNKEPVKYLFETFKMNYPYWIRDFVITENYCYLLLSDWNEDEAEVCQISLKGDIKKRFILPIKIEGKKVKPYLLRKSEEGLKIISLLESSEETYYCEFIIP